MTQLRDARLKQALEHAPDAHMAPDVRTRAAIRAAAMQGVVQAAVPAAPWWRRLMGVQASPSSSASRMPWNAALATVLLASLVTLIWRDEEIPGAKTGDPPIAAAPQAPRAASPAAVRPPAAAVPQPRVTQPSVAEPAVVPAPPAESRRPPAPQADALAKKAETAPAPAKPAAAAPEAERRELQEPALADAPAVVQAVPAPAPVPVPVPAPPPAFRLSPPAPAAAMPSRQAESRSMAEAARPASNLGGSVTADAARSRLAATGDAALQNWTEARITLEGRTSLVSRAQAGELPAQVRALALAVTGRSGATGPAVLQVELLEAGAVTGILVVGETTARWTQLRGGLEQGSSGSVDAALVRQLLTEAARLAPR